MKKKLYSLLGALPLLSLALSAQTATFNFTGGIQTFTVPCGVDTVFLQTWGGQGGAGANGNSNAGPTLGGAGGLGGYAEGWLVVSPGDVLNIFVGGQGATPTGGFNGGANGGSQNAGGGGGATDIRVGGTAEANRVLTAGGGGGGGRGGCESQAAIVGGAGSGGGSGLAGGNGQDAPTSGGAAGGGKGGNFGNVQGASGPAGTGCGGFLGSPGGTASTGTGASGGAGQSCCCFTFGSIPAGGGGGGGQIGGGGGGGGSAGTTGCSGNDKGAGGGGGGGSSYIGGVFNGATNAGIWLGNGMATISWTEPVPPAHTINASATSFCLGDSISLGVQPDQYSTFFTWTVPSGLNFLGGQNTTNIDVSGAAAGTYTIYVQGVNGTCSLNGPVDSILVTVNPLPTIAATSSASAICAGDSVTLTATGGDTYVWTPGNSTANPLMTSPSSTTTYTVTGTNTSTGCVSTANVTVTVNALPNVAATASDSSICTGSSTTLTATGAVTYLWNPGSSTANPFTVSPTATTTYTVTGTDSSGCVNTTTIDVTVNALPTVTLTTPQTVCVDDASFTLTGGSPAGGTYSGPGVTGSTFSPTGAGVGSAAIVYNFTDANGCSGSATSSINVSACTGIDDPSNLFGLTFMPNPVTDLLQVRWDSNKGDVRTLEIFDNTGRLVISKQVNNTNAVEIKVDELPVGNYNLVVKSNDSKATYRFVKK